MSGCCGGGMNHGGGHGEHNRRGSGAAGEAVHQGHNGDHGPGAGDGHGARPNYIGIGVVTVIILGVIFLLRSY